MGYIPISIGRVNGKPRFTKAHILAWTLVNGPVPKGKVVCHRCNNPRCCRVEHLYVGTQAENIHQSLREGRFNAFGRQKLDATKVREIRRLLAMGRLQKDIARQFGVGRSAIGSIKSGATWSHVDPPFVEGAEQSLKPLQAPVVDRPAFLNLPDGSLEFVPSRQRPIRSKVR